MAELPPLPFIPTGIYESSEIENKQMQKSTQHKERKGKEQKGTDINTHRRHPPRLSPPLRLLHTVIHLGRNFPNSVGARKSITPWSHSSTENSSDICMCLYLPTFQPIAFPTALPSALWWSPHQLQWRKRCSCIWAAILPPQVLHYQRLSSCRWPNCFR